MKDRVEYGIFVEANKKYVLIRDGFYNKQFASKRALALEKKFESQNKRKANLYVFKIKRD